MAWRNMYAVKKRCVLLWKRLMSFVKCGLHNYKRIGSLFKDCRWLRWNGEKIRRRGRGRDDEGGDASMWGPRVRDRVETPKMMISSWKWSIFRLRKCRVIKHFGWIDWKERKKMWIVCSKIRSRFCSEANISNEYAALHCFQIIFQAIYSWFLICVYLFKRMTKLFD